MIQQVVDGFVGNVDIFKFGQISIIFEMEEMAKIQSANHANIIAWRAADAIDGKIKCLQNVRDVDENVS